MDWLLWMYFTATCLVWCLFYIKATRLSLMLPAIVDVQPDPQFKLPKLSVIISAKDEADTIEQALQSILNTNYPDFEIIIVNDRSSDQTGTIIEHFAETHPRIVPIHITKLPENWIGKVHALQAAIAKAKGEWLLFTDADVHHHPNLWQRAVQLAMTNQYDHLALLPDVPTSGTLLQACIKAFGLMFLATAKVEHIEDPNHQAAIGIGAFNLVNRAAFNETPGFEWLRMEVADDYGIGIMMKKWGKKISFATAYTELWVDWYPNLSSMIRGLEKNIMAPGTRFETIRLLTSPILFAAIILAPFLSLLTWPAYYPLTGCIVFLVIAITSFWVPKSRPRARITWMLTPLGYLIILYTFIRACLLCLARNGIIWRGTFYPRALLRKYQRVKL